MKKFLALGIACCLLFTGCGKEETVEEITARPIEVQTVKRSDIASEMVYSGKVKAVEEVSVFTTVGGKAEVVYAKVGETVHKGAILFQMETADINNNYNVANASLATAQANLNAANTSLQTVNGATMQSQIDNAQAGSANAKLAYDNAKTTYENNKVLFEMGALSQTDMDKIKMSYDSATVSYEQAKNSLDLLQNKMSAENQQKASDAVKIAEANRNVAAAQVKSVEKTLADASVKSPITGVVTANNVVAGSLVAQAQPAFVVMDMSKMELVVGVSEQMINIVKQGETAKVTMSALSKEPFIGTIKTVSPAANQKGTYEVTVSLDNQEGKIKSGMLGQVSFVREKQEDSIVIPRETVMTEGKSNYVFIEEDGIAKKVTVTLGIDKGEVVEIKKGMTVGMSLITKGQTYLSDGDAVRIAQPTKKTEETKKETKKETTTSNEKKTEKTGTTSAKKGE